MTRRPLPGAGRSSCAAWTFSPGLAIVVVCYLAIYGGLLWWTAGLPYVLDNNESFSSLWHAYNLFHFDFWKSMGLADESFAYHAAAHPVVHTHQGNFPRLFAFLIYCLGATSIESQIVVSTFTVGLAAVLLAYVFFSRAADPLLATVFCLILMTDYVLVGQWQVVTYRVWHLFFVFSSLLCVHAVNRNRMQGAALTLINFAGLFYYELVFVFFVSLMTAIYAAIYLHRSSRDVLTVWAAQAAGGALALAVLTTQLALYMGWPNALQDFRFTFLGRNYLSDLGALAAQAQEFYDRHNIAFWYNLQDGSQYRSLHHLVGSLTYFELQVHTPFFTTACLIVLLGLWWGSMRFRNDEAPANVPIGATAPTGVLQSTPYLLGVLLSLTHLYTEQYRGEFGILQAFGAVLVLLSVLIAAAVDVRRARRSTAAAPTVSGAPRDAWLLSLVVLLGVFPGVMSHWSVIPVLLDRYSILFSAYLLIYLAVMGWVARNLFAAGTPRLWSRPDWTRLYRPPVSAAVTLLTISCCLLAGVAVSSEFAFGVPPERASLDLLSPATALFAAAIGLGMVAMPAKAGALRGAPSPWSAWLGAPGTDTLLRLCVYLWMITALLVFSPYVYNLYDSSHAAVWLEIADELLPGPLGGLTTCAVVVVSCALAMRHPAFAPWSRCMQAVRAVAPFLIAGLAAYAVTFFLAPAYIFTGYRFRMAPFTAFHTTTLAALAAYPLLLAARSLLGIGGGTDAAAPTRRTQPGQTEGMTGSRTTAIRLLCVAVLAILGVYWLGMQAMYVSLLPADHYAFLRLLREPPFRGATFVTNGYAGPIAAATGNWAYLDENLLRNDLVIAVGSNQLGLDTRYLWFADRGENPAYRRPEYFVCVTPQSFASLSAQALRRKTDQGAAGGGCGQHQLVRIARGLEPNTFSPKLELAAADAAGPARVGYERWAIVKLRWVESAGGREPGGLR
jgi:hypothetical protein